MNTDKDIARRYVELLTGSANTPMTWQLIHSKGSEPPRVIHGSVDDLWSRLDTLNHSGYGIYITVNETDLKGRKAENIKSIRALFIDIDDGRRLADLTLHIEPTLTVSSGRGDHPYWCIGEGSDLRKFTPAQKRLIKHYGSDPAIHDLPRVMRVPGFIHDKGHGQTLVSLSEGSGETHDIDQVTEFLTEAPIPAFTVPEKSSGGGTVRMDSRTAHAALASYVSKIPGVSEGGRNRKGFEIACKHGRFGVSADEMMPHMQQWNQRNTPPMEEPEMESIIANAVRHGKEELRDPPESKKEHHLRVAADGETADPEPIKILPKGFPALKMPGVYAVDDTGVWYMKRVQKGDQLDFERVEVCPEPIVLTRYIRDTDGSNVFIEIQWKMNGRWHKTTQSREILMSKQKIVSMSGCGLPVHSDNAGRMMRFFDSFERENRDVIPIQECSDQMGWIGNDGFLCGETWVKAKEGAKEVVFRGEESSDDYLAKSICSSGEFDEWKNVFVNEVSLYPKAALAAYASLAPVIMEIMEAPGFAVDWSYRTSSGKTTTMRIAASVWGRPDERGGSIIGSWDSTQVYIERRAAMFNGIPLILDESKRVRWPNMVPNVVYMVANGQGRGRGKKAGGVQSIQRFRTVLLSTGEQRLTDFSKDGGLATRVLSFWGSPFGETSKRAKGSIDEINAVLRKNYGHAGPEFVKWVTNNVDRVKAVAAMKGQFESEYCDLLGETADAGIAYRLAEYNAILRVTELLVIEAFGLPESCACIAKTMSSSSENIDTTRREDQALEHVIGWASSREQMFRGREGDSKPSRFLGVWREGGDMCWHKDAITQALKEGGFDVESTLRLWMESDVIVPQGGRDTRIIRHDKRTYRCVCIRAGIVGENSPEAEPGPEDCVTGQLPSWST